MTDLRGALSSYKEGRGQGGGITRSRIRPVDPGSRREASRRGHRGRCLLPPPARRAPRPLEDLLQPPPVRGQRLHRHRRLPAWPVHLRHRLPEGPDRLPRGEGPPLAGEDDPERHRGPRRPPLWPESRLRVARSDPLRRRRPPQDRSRRRRLVPDRRGHVRRLRHRLRPLRPERGGRPGHDRPGLSQGPGLPDLDPEGRRLLVRRLASTPFQPYFESGFPYRKDQFISTAATAWAATALALACPKP